MGVADLHNLSDRDLLILTAQKVEGIEYQVSEEVKARIATNGIVADLKQGYYRLQGAMWVLGLLLTIGIAPWSL